MAIGLLLLAVTALFAFIQLLYFLMIYSRLLWHKATESSGEPVGVTVLVCAWNELENIKELLPILDKQQYPVFEVIILDDRSWDGTGEFLDEQAGQWENIRHIKIAEAHDYITPKKYAITIGMKHAKYPVVLMTDADCRPADETWIQSMTSQLVDEKDIVLGFSPYFLGKGLLNWFIRCETFYTAVQYFSFAKAGLAYMGVGRNLMYKKDLFFSKKGFYSHKNIVGGDDDLFINESANRRNVAINIEPESFCWSIPKTTWKEWFKQKKRHLSVGKYYRIRNKLLLGLLSFSHVGLWITGIGGLVYFGYFKEFQYLEWLGILIGVRWLIQLIILGFLNRKLGATLAWYSLIFVDFALFLYYVLMGFVMVFSKKRNVQWR